MALQKYGNIYNEKGTPIYGSALWYRLMALETLTYDQVKDMLAYLAGYTEDGWDKAYESALGKPLGDADDDAVNDYALNIKSAYPDRLTLNYEYGKHEKESK